MEQAAGSPDTVVAGRLLSRIEHPLQPLAPRSSCSGGLVITEAIEIAAATGAATLAATITTEAWEVARKGTARLFRRDAARLAAVEALLDSNATLVATARDPDRTREALVPTWTVELENLLDEYPDALEELQELTAALRRALPPAQESWVLNQTNTATGNATQYSAGRDQYNAGRDQHIDRP
jgi:hypothetical protein